MIEVEERVKKGELAMQSLAQWAVGEKYLTPYVTKGDEAKCFENWNKPEQVQVRMSNVES